MVLGIVGMTLGWMPLVFVVGAVCSLLAIIFGAIVMHGRGEPRGFALTGTVTGGAGLLLVVVGVVTTRAVTNALNDFVDEPRAVVALDRCVAGDGTAIVEGTIENVGDRPSDYRIVVRVGRQPSLSQRVVIEVDDVRPGALRRSARRQTSASSTTHPMSPAGSSTSPAHRHSVSTSRTSTVRMLELDPPRGPGFAGPTGTRARPPAWSS